MKQSQEYKIGKELFAYIRKHGSNWNLFDKSFLKNQMLKLSLSNRDLQQQMFRFVDVLPSLKTEEQVAQYLFEYLSQGQVKLDSLTDLFSSTPFLNSGLEASVKFSVKLLAKTFIVGSTVEEAIEKIRELKDLGQSYTLDILGELVLSEKEAQEHFDQYLELIRMIPQANVSVKLSALCAQINPLDFKNKKEILKDRLRTIYKEAKNNGAHINVDTEHYFWKDFTFNIVQELLMEDEFKAWDGAGIVIQAYLRDSEVDLKKWIRWAKQRASRITVRLVKGAYWDYEKAISEQNNWPCPVYTKKYDSDLNYEKLTELLLDHHRYLKPALASHNIRSLAHALAYADAHAIDKSRFELQMLYGMMDPLKELMAKTGYEIRIYLPYGELIPGMSYLVRRLLENTANDSFLKQGILDKGSEDKLLRAPEEIKSEDETSQPSGEGFINAANLDFSQRVNRENIAEAIEDLSHELSTVKLYPLIINSSKVFNEHCFETINPAKPEQVLARVSYATTDDCDNAIASAELAQKKWSALPVEQRAAVLRICAEKLEEKRLRFNTLLCLEAAKPYQEADGEVSEAVDFLNYYADQAETLYGEDGLRSMTGERNSNHYQAYGIAAVISPWNFPLAIMAGMVSAALVMGNAVIVKPSQQTSLVVYEFLDLLNASLVEIDSSIKGLISFMPGKGSVVGNYLAEHGKVRLIAFTGSSEVGMKLSDIAGAARPVKRIVAEMGGKNAIIVDDSADLDEAIPGVLHSAFGFAGQKCSACSRLIVHAEIYDQFCERLAEAAQAINICDPSDEACFVPPQIDQTSMDKTNDYIELGKREAELLVGDLDLPEQGFYVSPSVFTGLDSTSEIWREEIFGPVLAVMKANDLDHALELANDSDYALTGGFYSRSPLNIEKVSQEFQVGNLYVNRSCTGAIVSRQAFGGLKTSSIGFKAGGPNYLLQFVQEKTITENTMRRGFAI